MMDRALGAWIGLRTRWRGLALPIFDGNVRKRPVSVQNEGNSNAFVTCSWGIEIVDGTRSTGISEAEVWFHSTAAGSVTCTGVAGWNGVQVQSVKTLTLPGGGSASGADATANTWNSAPISPGPFPASGRSIWSRRADRRAPAPPTATPAARKTS